MKDLIIIGAYCPDEERQELLHNLVNSLSSLRESYDILISSHSIIPDYITTKVDFIFFEKNNNLIINDLKYLNQPWFKPNNETTIHSTFVSGYSTYLSVYKLLIGGLGLGKTLGYKKAHYIEYDTIMSNLDEFYDNTKLLDSYSSIQYKNKDILPWGIGNFMSFNLTQIDPIFLEYDEKKLLSFIEHYGKTNERVTEEILLRTSRLEKDFKVLEDKGIKVNLSSKAQKDDLDFWTVPYYDPKTGNLNFICWNQRSKDPIDVSVITNNNKLTSFKSIAFRNYHIKELGPISEIDNILVLINNKVKTHIDFNYINKEDFMNTNNVKHD
jgi:hypothetical protein|tara:strand:- start:458 stop:1435 length:978 start_codon:yes stop_codon:yes gene_type:complete